MRSLSHQNQKLKSYVILVTEVVISLNIRSHPIDRFARSRARSRQESTPFILNSHHPPTSTDHPITAT